MEWEWIIALVAWTIVNLWMFMVSRRVDRIEGQLTCALKRELDRSIDEAGRLRHSRADVRTS